MLKTWAEKSERENSDGRDFLDICLVRFFAVSNFKNL